ncbi:hypothetical protein BG011_002455, partial [Mortierella polycephala]
MSVYAKHANGGISDLHLGDSRRGFNQHHGALLMDFILGRSSIPGDNIFSKAYALSVLPVVVSSVSLLGLGLKIKKFLFKRKKVYIIDRWEYRAYTDEQAQDLTEAWRQLNNGTESNEAKFNYYIASLMLCLSSVAYWPRGVDIDDYEDPESEEARDWLMRVLQGKEFIKSSQRSHQ